MLRLIAVICFVVALHSGLMAQRVGLVMSGGGAAALAHIGVIKALEENNIPIDYITGTSMGAFVGALYAVGYTPEQMDSLVTSELFLMAASGELENKQRYYYYNQNHNASMVNLMINNRFNVQSLLPTNLVKPTLMDLMLLEQFTPASTQAGYDFNKLVVPFRCVAADIEHKEEVIFSGGNLAEAVRASVTYPFYFEPVPIEGKMLFDGGLYNNFPMDVMYDAFMPDYIIGSNVTGNIEPPTDDDLLSQLKNMIMDKSSFDPVCEHGIIIQSNLDVGTFDFQNLRQIIDRGYQEATLMIDSICADVTRKRNAEELKAKRDVFRAETKSISFDNIEIKGVNASQSQYVSRVIGLRKNEGSISFETFRKRFYHLVQDNKIRYVYPSAVKSPNSDHYTLNLYVKKEKEVSVEFGGHVSSKPVNTGYIGLRYGHFARRSVSLYANTYFGKFYGSAHVKLNFEFPGRAKLSIAPIFTLNRWDYFKSFANFFEESKPSFIVQNDWYTGLELTKPLGTNGIVQLDGKYARLLDQYYQNDLFTPSDTSDQTYFRNVTAGLRYENNTLNRKEFPAEGHLLTVKARYINGREETVPGSTNLGNIKSNVFREWVQLEAEAQQYFRMGRFFSSGVFLKAVYTNRPLFSNYSATIISAPAFQPVPESRTFFQEEFRAHQYLAGGIKGVLKFTKNIHLRLEGYSFLPYRRIERDENNMAQYGPIWERPYFMGSSAVVYHSPIGPISFSANYYENRPDEHWSFIFSFGYAIFNKRAFE